MDEPKIIRAHWLDFSIRLIKATMRVKYKDELIEEVTDFINNREDPEIRGWCVSVEWESIVSWQKEPYKNHAIMCDTVDEAFSDAGDYRQSGERISGSRSDRIICVLRAGLDVAIPEECSSGVIGYTAGNIRKMYPEGIPSWVYRFLDFEGVPPFDSLTNDRFVVL